MPLADAAPFPLERGRNKFAILSVEEPAWQGAKRQQV